MKPSILAVLRERDLEIYKKLYEANKYNLIVLGKEQPLLEENGIKTEKLEDFASMGQTDRSTVTSQQICNQLQGVVQEQDFQKQFVFNGHNFFEDVKDNFINSLMAQIPSEVMLIDAFDNLISQRNVKLVVVWTDVVNWTKTITRAAQKHKIPVLQIYHGYGFSYNVGHTESLVYADKVTGEGEERTRWAQLYEQENKITKTGNPYLDVYTTAKKKFNKEKICKQFGLDPKKPIITFGSTWTNERSVFKRDASWLDSVYRTFLKAYKKLRSNNPNIQLLIKLHYVQKGQGDKYKEIASEEGIADVVVIDENLAEALYICDALVTFESSIIIDALMLEKPVLVLDFPEILTKRSFLKDYPIVFACGSKEIEKGLEKVILNKAYRKTIKAQKEKIDDGFNYLNDGKAIDRILKVMNSMVTEAKPAREQTKEDILEDAYYESFGPMIYDCVPSKLKKVLHVSCGSGVLGRKLKEKGIEEVYGIVQDKDQAKEAKKYLDSVIEGDVETLDLPYSNDFFNGIIFSDVLEDIRDPWSYFKNMARYLKQTGIIICSIPNVANIQLLISLLQGRWEYRDYGMLKRDHLRFFTLNEIPKMFEDAGLEIEEIKPFRIPVHPSIAQVGKAIAESQIATQAFLQNCDALQYIVIAKKKKRKKK